MQILSGFLTFRHGKLLADVLKLGTGSLKAFGQIRAVQQFERRDIIPLQPFLKQAADFFARQGAIKFLRRRTDGIAAGDGLDLLFLGRGALVKNAE